MKSTNDTLDSLNGTNYSAVNVSKFRRYLPQILASSVKNLLVLNLGITMAFSIIIIPAVTGITGDKNPDEIIFLTASQASWFGGLSFFTQPLGSLFSGWICKPFGRRPALFIVNIPYSIALLTLYNASQVWHIFLANILIGIAVGLMEVPAITYIGEIAEPTIRGMLFASAELTVQSGVLSTLFLGSIFTWRMVALFSLIVPIIAMFTICFVPETPVWLLSKKRPNDALKSLQWLRGCVAKSEVKEEFEQLQNYQNSHETHAEPNVSEQFHLFCSKGTLRAFFLLLFVFWLAMFFGLNAYLPYIIQILIAYGVSIDANWAATIIQASAIASTSLLLCTVHLIGKRKIYLTSILGSGISCIALAAYGYMTLSPGWTSFDKHSAIETELAANNLFPFYAFIALTFFSNLSLLSLPWMLLSEIFSYRVRPTATGLAAAIAYFLGFLGIKAYYNFESAFSMQGVALIYGVVFLLGFIVTYFILPETEGRTLEEIERYFADDGRKITDRKIPKMPQMSTQSGKNEMESRT